MMKPEDWEEKEPQTKTTWLLIIFFFLPWLLGLGVVGMALLELID